MFAVSWCMLPVYLSAQPLEVESFSALHLFLFVYILSTSMGPITSWLIFVKGILMEVCKYIELWFMLEGLISWVRNWKVLQLMGTSALGDLQELAVIQWISWKKLELSRVPSISAVASRSWGFTSTLTLQWPLFFFFFFFPLLVCGSIILSYFIVEVGLFSGLKSTLFWASEGIWLTGWLRFYNQPFIIMKCSNYKN